VSVQVTVPLPAAQFCVAAGAKLTPSVDMSNWYVIDPVPPEAALAVTVSVWPWSIGVVTCMSEGALNWLTVTVVVSVIVLIPSVTLTQYVVVEVGDTDVPLIGVPVHVPAYQV
jgi:hypothetical protein